MAAHGIRTASPGLSCGQWCGLTGRRRSALGVWCCRQISLVSRCCVPEFAAWRTASGLSSLVRVNGRVAYGGFLHVRLVPLGSSRTVVDFVCVRSHVCAWGSAGLWMLCSLLLCNGSCAFAPSLCRAGQSVCVPPDVADEPWCSVCLRDACSRVKDSFFFPLGFFLFSFFSAASSAAATSATFSGAGTGPSDHSGLHNDVNPEGQR